ncbi:unnamed protein product [Orchesella dallaii]|uniref:Protein farnesyltransferase subunit beta n=1 Tax=Orchesella dallaii TaxID=48710 RepID=A0ABP1S5E3_9HEXA
MAARESSPCRKSQQKDKDGLTVVGLRSLEQLQNTVTQDEGKVTHTYLDQEEVESQILEIYLKCNKNAAKYKEFEITLQREKHIAFLRRGLKQLSDAYEALDASRPWLCYWILHSLNLLGVKLSKEECSNISKFLMKCQDPRTGGFGGGPYQMAHLAATYAALNALVSLGTDEALSVVDKESLLKFIISMKLPDGSFRMHRGGEVDVRAVYCAVVVAKLTNISLPNVDLFEGTAEWILRCQTYEGGFGGCPGMEAHGGYTFCAVAALILLNRIRLIDEDSLLRWLVHRQMAVEGGFQGRTNKLVDGCYSFWQGACFCLIGPILAEHGEVEKPSRWLLHNSALQEYVLICCQHHLGGLIDKPGKQRDYYHTCYTLSGLSAVQHQPDGTKLILDNASNELKKIHPVFNLTEESVEKALQYYYNSAHARATVSEEMEDTSEPSSV